MSGMDMMFDALKRMIPASVWELVEKNVVGIKTDTGNIAKRLENLEAQSAEILKRLDAPRTYITAAQFADDAKVINGAASQTE